MNTSLMTNGLGDLDLSGATTDTVGGSSTTVYTACDNLESCASNLNGFIESLTAQNDQILQNLEGTAADTLRENFPGLIGAFEDIPKSIKSVAEWARTTMENYVSVDAKTAEIIQDIMGR